MYGRVTKYFSDKGYEIPDSYYRVCLILGVYIDK